MLRTIVHNWLVRESAMGVGVADVECGNIFNSVPLDGSLLFSVPLSIGGLGGLVGCMWGAPIHTKESSPPLKVRGLGARRKSSREMG